MKRKGKAYLRSNFPSSISKCNGKYEQVNNLQISNVIIPNKILAIKEKEID